MTKPVTKAVDWKAIAQADAQCRTRVFPCVLTLMIARRARLCELIQEQLQQGEWQHVQLWQMW